MTAAVVAKHVADLGKSVRAKICSDRMNIVDASLAVEIGGVDTIFALDRKVESTLIECIERWPKELLPVAVIGEGLNREPTIVGGTPLAQPKFWVLIDPIDGTRGLMYEKRSAYFLAAVAPGYLGKPRLSDSIASVGVELPTSKAAWADTFIWSAGCPVIAVRDNLLDGTEQSLSDARPSRAADLSNAFGSVVAFFPEGKRTAAELAEEIALSNKVHGQRIQIFDDQYISSGGQMVELLTGRDRFIVDVRPLLYANNRSMRGLCCHPYDLALAPLAKAAGVILCGPNGEDLDAPYALDVDVAWCGYANKKIQRLVEPIVRRTFEGQF